LKKKKEAQEVRYLETRFSVANNPSYLRWWVLSGLAANKEDKNNEQVSGLQYLFIGSWFCARVMVVKL